MLSLILLELDALNDMQSYEPRSVHFHFMTNKENIGDLCLHSVSCCHQDSLVDPQQTHLLGGTTSRRVVGFPINFKGCSMK